MKSAAGIDYEILHGESAFSMLRVQLKRGQSVKAQSGAMVAMDSTMDVEGKQEGGLLGGLGRLVSGENFFFQTLSAANGDGEGLLAPATPGAIADLEMDGTPYYLQKGGFFAATEGVEIKTKMQNLTSGLFSGKGFFVLGVSGRGILFAESFGAIHAVDIPPGKDVIIDNQHLVAWPQNIRFNIEKAAKGWMSSMTSGEGLVCRFQGPGKVLIQTRNQTGFGQWVHSLLPGK
jgi:uncharacterized protein (TIGR00266 family)